MISKIITTWVLLGLLKYPVHTDANTWQICILFLFAIFNLMNKTFDIGAMGVIIITAGALQGTFSIQEAIQIFGKPLAWQIISIFFIAKGIIKTRLSERISYHLIKLFGKSTLGLSYGISIANLIIGPLIPSSTARIGVIFQPILKEIFNIFSLISKENSAHKFLTLVCLHSNAIVAATFLTSMAGNLLIQNIAAKAGFTITWLGWFTHAIVPSLITLSVVPLLIFKLINPEIKNLTSVQNSINQKIENLGPLKKDEVIMSCSLAAILIGWTTNIVNPLLVTFIGISFLLIVEIIKFEEDIANNKEAWSTLVWLSVLLMLSDKLNSTNILNVLINNIQIFLATAPNYASLIFLMLFYAYSHYIFASISSHISALYLVTLDLALKTGYDGLTLCFIFAFLSNLFSGLTKYTSTEAMILSKMGYVEEKEFAKIGFIVSTTMMIIWILTYVIWSKVRIY